MYSSIAWVPRGKASSTPIRLAPNQSDIDESKKEQEKIDENERFASQMNAALTGENPAEDEVDMKNPIEPEIEDPNLNPDLTEIESDIDEDYGLLDKDCVMLAAKSDEDQSTLEVHVYDEESGNFFLHHDFILPAFPLSMAWLECSPSQDPSGALLPGSYVAVGTFQPGIEIWDCDLMDAIEPECTLGGLVEGKERTLKPSSHTLAVMGLSANKIYKNVLASSSADKTVKLWDITTQRCMITMKQHTDKVQGVTFHPYEASILASCSYDHTACVFDCRCASYGSVYKLPVDPESIEWDPYNPYNLYIAMEDGSMINYDIRNNTQAVYKCKLHDSNCTSIKFNPEYKGLMASCGNNCVKLWDMRNNQCTCVGENTMDVETLYGMNWYPSAPHIIGCGGSDERICIWDVQETCDVLTKFEHVNAQTPNDLSFSVSEEAKGEVTDLHEGPNSNKDKKSKKGKKGKKN